MNGLLRLARRNLLRRPVRAGLTALGAAVATFLFVGIETFGTGLEETLENPAARRSLVVFRRNRYCPQTSRLPLYYKERILEIPGVRGVRPVKVFLNNCRTSLDLVAFHGSPPSQVLEEEGVELLKGSAAAFKADEMGALVGRGVAARRDLEVGDTFNMGPVRVNVHGIFASEDPSREGTIIAHLQHIQRSSPGGSLGTVTQFEVEVEGAGRAEEVARKVDALFESSEAPTGTRTRADYLAGATVELRELVRFARVFGLACVGALLVLVANTMLMGVHERRGELGVLLTLGYRPRHLFGLVLGETLFLTLAGAVPGLLGAAAVVRLSGAAVGVEGVSVALSADPATVATGLGVALAGGLAAGLLPAWRAAGADLLEVLRSA